MKLYCFLFVLSIGACGQPRITGEPVPLQKPDTVVIAGFDTAYYGISTNNITPTQYDLQKNQVNRQRKMLYSKYLLQQKPGNILDTARYTMTENLLNKIIPAWYGTPWAFEGYTAIPQNGEIACGYFVSTTLKHAGFNVDRYKLAQKKPETEARSIQQSANFEVLESISPADLKDHFIQNKKDGIYFVGLSNHVGYLLLRKGELFFIHSNYIGSQGVTIEKAAYSQALSYSRIYYLADITHNDVLVKLWLEGKPLKIG